MIVFFTTFRRELSMIFPKGVRRALSEPSWLPLCPFVVKTIH